MPASTSLRGRVPGQAVIGAIVAAQREVAPRSSVARVFGVSPLAPSTRRLYRAALGEVAVGEMLDQLGPRWDVLHVVPVAETQIDHLIIGPPGVFAITTENYPAQEVRVTASSMTIAGRPSDDICAARRLAAAASDRLGKAAGRTVPVEPVVVIIEPGKLTLREQPEGVTIVTSKHLIRHLTRLDRAFAGSEVAYISDVAERDTTWETVPTPPEHALQLTRDFTLLRKQVRDAAQTRIVWSAVGFLAICAVVWITTALIVDSMLH